MFPSVDALQLQGFQRCPENPLIKPCDVPPSGPTLRVVGAFNPGAVQLRNNQETVLLMRVSETFLSTSIPDGESHVPLAVPTIAQELTPEVLQASLHRERLQKSDESYDFNSDARVILTEGKSSSPQTVAFLTSISHLRCARSTDGVHFIVDEVPFLFPGVQQGNASQLSSDEESELKALLAMEQWGIEDPRIVDMHAVGNVASFLPPRVSARLDKNFQWQFLLTYTAVSRFGAATTLAVVTSDFRHVVRVGVIFLPENKDVCIFPARIGADQATSSFFCYNRPVPKSFGSPDIWCSLSSDLVGWGQHRHILGTSNVDVAGAAQQWDAGRVGGGAPSVLCSKGWLHIYHAADKSHRYCLGALVADAQNPTKLIARSALPILCPDEEYEAKGFFPNVVFTCGTVVRRGQRTSELDDSEDQLWVYYGAADDKIALAVFRLGYIYRLLSLL